MTQPKAIRMTLRWPPTETRYWTRIMRGKHSARIISEDGIAFRSSVALLFKLCPSKVKFHGSVAVDIELRRNDARRFDVDNFAKSVLDGLTHAGVWRDDSQVDVLTIRRGPKAVGESRAIVTITELAPE